MKKNIKRKKRILKKIYGTDKRPRLSIFRSNQHFYGQIIDDINHRTIISSSSLPLKKEVEEAEKKYSLNCSITSQVGQKLGVAILKKEIEYLVFDKNGRPYHGKIKAFANAVRNEGIKF